MKITILGFERFEAQVLIKKSTWILIWYIFTHILLNLLESTENISTLKVKDWTNPYMLQIKITPHGYKS